MRPTISAELQRDMRIFLGFVLVVVLMIFYIGPIVVPILILGIPAFLAFATKTEA